MRPAVSAASRAGVARRLSIVPSHLGVAAVAKHALRAEPIRGCRPCSQAPSSWSARAVHATPHQKNVWGGAILLLHPRMVQHLRYNDDEIARLSPLRYSENRPSGRPLGLHHVELRLLRAPCPLVCYLLDSSMGMHEVRIGRFCPV